MQGVIVSYKTSQQESQKSGAECARKLEQRGDGLGGTWHLDALFSTIRGEQRHLWRAVGQNGDVIVEAAADLPERMLTSSNRSAIQRRLRDPEEASWR